MNHTTKDNLNTKNSKKIVGGKSAQKNESSVKNPITFNGDSNNYNENIKSHHHKKKGEFYKDMLYSTHGNFRPDDRCKNNIFFVFKFSTFYELSLYRQKIWKFITRMFLKSEWGEQE